MGLEWVQLDVELAEECNGVRFDLTAQLVIVSNESGVFLKLCYKTCAY